MPWHAFAELTEDDAKAIAAFLQNLAPASNRIPGPFKPGDKVSTVAGGDRSNRTEIAGVKAMLVARLKAAQTDSRP